MALLASTRIVYQPTGWQPVESVTESISGTSAGVSEDSAAASVLVSVAGASAGASEDSGTVSGLPAPETNEPAGYTTLFHADGTSRNYGELATDSNIALVSDVNAPNGSAIEWRWPVGSGPGHTALYNPSFGPVSEIYYRIVRAYNPNWQNHSGGDKLMYFGHVGKASSYFLQLRGGQDWGDGDYRVGFQNQAPNLGSPSFLWISDDPVLGEEAFAHTDGAYHVWEVQMVAQSEAGAADGIFRLWYDGDLKEERTDMQWVTAGDVRFQGCEYRPYWGGSGGETKQVSPYDWLRDGELYISGRA